MAAVRHRPRGLRRRWISLSAIIVIGALTGIVALANQLRHPLPGEGVLSDELADPRQPVTCPEPEEVIRRAGELGVAAQPVEVSSGDLLSCPRSYQARRVRYTGEVVGEVLDRSDHAWVQVNDDVYADVGGALPLRPDYAGGNSGVGVRLPEDATETITQPGGPRHHGEVIAVEGRFHRAAPGSADAVVVIADHVEVVRAAEPIVDPVLRDRRLVAIALALLATAMVVTERVVAARRR